jgi:hypothetical protein
MLVLELTVPRREVISIVLTVIRVECSYLLAPIPALDTFSNIIRHIKALTKREEQVHIFLLDLVCKTARLCYKYLARAKVYISSVLPCPLYA